VTGLAYLAALFLAGVLALAGVAKLRDRPGTVRSFRALGLPAPLATAVPVVELLLAAGLVVLPGWSAAVALAVLAAFTTFLARAVRDGVAAPCNCFGSTGGAAVSAVELVRNLLLAAVAVVALTAGGPRRPSLVAVGTAVAAAVAGRVTLVALRRD
jgi:uncharacterized membrane protein YphA (DoxX/SURF4 family)